ncbi:hypothetical protein PybrP1_007479 [[Pythium] brassicae (nom. inval.)]|nr:hypothetical protein PybrP1_007479 [[Pythium] brassicae (nom. inval.)]
MVLSFYTRAPTQAAQLGDMEQLGSQRVRLLRAVAGADASAAPPELLVDATDEESDKLAHFTLRLAFCTSPDLSEWFLAAESELFARRLRHCAAEDALALLASEGVRYEPVQEEETTPDGPAFKVPFQDAPQLVRHRRVPLRNGVCVVPLRCMRAVAAHHFRVALEQQLKILRRAQAANTVDDRLAPMFARFAALVRAHDRRHHHRGNKLSRVTPASVDAAAETHFPLCARHLHRQFRAQHHLKYDGRVQYRMFLKGLGWPVHDALAHFRREFVRVLPPATFDREYAYHIRHSYGLEGARRDYAPPDCRQILRGAAPRLGQHHGCPFRHWDAAHLSAELRAAGLSATATAPIVAQAVTGSCQRACQSHFDATHRLSYADAARQSGRADEQEEEAAVAAASVTHPNTWLDVSFGAV